MAKVSFQDGEIAKVDAAAKARGLSRSEFIRHLVIASLNQQPVVPAKPQEAPPTESARERILWEARLWVAETAGEEPERPLSTLGYAPDLRPPTPEQLTRRQQERTRQADVRKAHAAYEARKRAAAFEASKKWDLGPDEILGIGELRYIETAWDTLQASKQLA